MPSTPEIEGVCHCGAVKLSANRAPDSLTECNCSVCRRLGALWAYYEPLEAVVTFEGQPTAAYSWQSRMLEFHHCRTCGCTTHYTTTNRAARQLIALNARTFPPEEIDGIRIRLFDGANTWCYLDERD